MGRRFVAFLGLATMGVGIWLIAADASKNAECDKNPNVDLTALGASCQRIVFSFFGGVALVAVGLLVLLTALALMRRSRRLAPRQPDPPMDNEVRYPHL
jgi:hypothetical protein